MGFGPPAALGAKIAAPNRVVISLVGDGGFGQNPAALATAAEENLAVVWVVMNNNAFGTIAGLQKAHFGLTYGTVSLDTGPSSRPITRRSPGPTASRASASARRRSSSRRSSRRSIPASPASSTSR